MTRTIWIAALAAVIATPTIIQSAQAGTLTELSARKHRTTDPNGNAAEPCTVVSRKTQAKARVGCAHVAAFQAYVDDLEAGGAVVRFMGGVRRGKCWSGGLHPCGKALDVCQLSRGRVDPRCHLPGRREIADVAERHGLVEGGRWRHSDYGHAQVGGYAGIAVAEMSRHSTALTARSHRRQRVSVAAAVATDDRLTPR